MEIRSAAVELPRGGGFNPPASGGSWATPGLEARLTTATGTYAVKLPQAGLPCVLRASGGTVNGTLRQRRQAARREQVELPTPGVPAGENGLSMTFQGQSVLWQVAPSASLNEGTYYAMSVTSANTYPAQAMYISVLPNQVGSYDCGSGPPYRKLSAYVRWDYVYYNANDTVGGCTIHLTQVGTTIEGTFSGTFVSNTSVEKVVTQGHFRFTLPQ